MTAPFLRKHYTHRHIHTSSTITHTRFSPSSNEISLKRKTHYSAFIAMRNRPYRSWSCICQQETFRKKSWNLESDKTSHNHNTLVLEWILQMQFHAEPTPRSHSWFWTWMKIMIFAYGKVVLVFQHFFWVAGHRVKRAGKRTELATESLARTRRPVKF